MCTLFVGVVLVDRNIASLIVSYIHRSMREGIPYAGATAVGFDSPLDLVRGTGDAPPESLGEGPAIILPLGGNLGAGQVGGIV